MDNSTVCDVVHLHDNDSVLPGRREEAFEYEQHDPPPILKGRLKAHISFWESINANRFLVDLIRSGYRFPFVDTPVSRYFPNNTATFDHQQFVTSAITELVNNSAVVEVDFVPHVVSPLSVSVNSSGKSV